MKIKCAHCKKSADKPPGAVNRARKAGLRIFCGRRCSGLGRRKHIPKAVKRVLKAIYDAEYRRQNRAMLKAKKRAYFARTYDPEKARIERKKTMPRHIEYCRRPEYKRWKQAYDRKHLAKKHYGPFAEVVMLTMDLNREIKGRMTNHEIRWQNKTSNKSQFRARAAKEEERSRPRNRFRRRSATHSAVIG